MDFIDFGVVSPDRGLELEMEQLEHPYGRFIVYTRDRPTVSLGRFNDMEKCIDIGYAERNGISIVRRMSGGSAIYTDQGQLTFSVTLDREAFGSKEKAYSTVCNGLVRSLAHLGVVSEYKPSNDVLVNGRKISGCAQYRDRERILVHGSLIIRLDSGTMDSILMPIKKRKYGGLTSLEEHLGYIPDRRDIMESFKEGFRDLR